MQEQTGLIAGAIWEALNTKGELTMGKLKENREGVSACRSLIGPSAG